ncbi:hypothetical protein MRX96_044940 [Rhipicephalus microplus]
MEGIRGGCIVCSGRTAVFCGKCVREVPPRHSLDECGAERSGPDAAPPTPPSLPCSEPSLRFWAFVGAISSENASLDYRLPSKRTVVSAAWLLFETPV